jgi:putative DNA primase/helicase
MIITINIFKKLNANKPATQHTLTAAEFRSFAKSKKHSLLQKTAAKLFNVSVYGNQGSRKAENIIAVSGIILDIDEASGGLASIHAAIDQLRPVSYWLYSTNSHSAESPKFRIVVPLSKSVTPVEFKEQNLAMRLAAYLGLTADECSSLPTQLYYLPTTQAADAEYLHIVGESEVLFDASILPQTAAPASKGSSKDEADASHKYRKVEEVIDDLFDGVRPMFVNDQFYVYADGLWRSIPLDKSFRRNFAEYFDCKFNLKDVDLIIDYLLTMSAESELPLALSHKLTFLNGTFNTHTCQLEEHNPLNYHLVGFDYDFDAAAACPTWLRALNDFFAEDDDCQQKIEFLRQWFGLLVTPRTEFHKMLMLYGSGSNGKSVVNSAARMMLGDKSVCSIPLEQLGARFMGAGHQNKLANILDEMPTNGLMSESELKRIVSSDVVTVERKGVDPFSFKPTARIMVATNSLPQSKDSSFGLDRRLIILTFNHRFTDEQIDRNLTNKLYAERAGIMQWALQGLAQLDRQGEFTIVPSSVVAVQKFSEQRSSAAQFVRDCVRKSVKVGKRPNLVRARKLYSLYGDYCQHNRLSPFSRNKFGEKLKELEIQQCRSNGDRFYEVDVVELEEFGVSPVWENGDRVTIYSHEDEAK